MGDIYLQVNIKDKYKDLIGTLDYKVYPNKKSSNKDNLSCLGKCCLRLSLFERIDIPYPPSINLSSFFQVKEGFKKFVKNNEFVPSNTSLGEIQVVVNKAGFLSSSQIITDETYSFKDKKIWVREGQLVKPGQLILSYEFPFKKSIYSKSQGFLSIDRLNSTIRISSTYLLFLDPFRFKTFCHSGFVLSDKIVRRGDFVRAGCKMSLFGDIARR